MTDAIDSIDTKDAIDKWIEIHQKEFKLRLYRRPHEFSNHKPGYEFLLIAEYDVAVGMPEYPTPKGKFCILRKAKRPDWHPPDRDWVTPEMRDENGVPKTISGDDPLNPIRGSFLDLGDGIGVHGTSNVASIGTRASHGCIRVTEDEALELYRRVPCGTPVRIF